MLSLLYGGRRWRRCRGTAQEARTLDQLQIGMETPGLAP
jgi:hypothetical protein